MRSPLLLATLLAACSGGGSSPPAPPPPPPPVTGACTPVPGTPALTVQPVASGLDRPLDLQAPPGDRSRLFVVEQPGRIRVLVDGVLDPVPFLDIADRVGSQEQEQGLLGLAFHPAFASNGRFFVNYTDRAGDTRLAEFRVAAGAARADAASERVLLQVDQPFANHNGGGLAFGADGMLYAGLGDGGSGGDPLGNAQNLGTLLGKLLRIDVDAAMPYGIPAGNPFRNRPGARPEIWAYGLRNPWRFAFDRATGDLFIADVGQGQREEVDVMPAGRSGDNFGWRIMEGTACFDPPSGCPQAGLTPPVLDYGRDEGCSIIGGPVYRGCRMPGYHGHYFYSDFCSAFVRSFRYAAGGAVDRRDWTASLGGGLTRTSAFGVDADGELYIVSLAGTVLKVVPAP